jgi:hypothetical protein
MTKKEFMTKYRPGAMDIAYKQFANQTNFYLSVDQECDLILDEWWYDYEHERM